VSFRARSIDGVGTSTAGFVGTTSTGPLDGAVRVASFADYQRAFGDVQGGGELPLAVQLFFANGGSDAWIVGVAPDRSPADALGALDAVPDLGLLCLPGQTDPSVLIAALRYAESRRAFVVIDPPGPNPDAAVALARELAGTGSANGAMYFPSALVADPAQSGPDRPCPPSGAVAGVYARTDLARGVWKAPAGLEAVLQGAQGLEVALDDRAASALQVAGVNTIRTFPGAGTVVWGARTIQGADEAASEWKYVPVRRLALFVEESLYRGTQWAVFEPNDEPLWASLRFAVGSFLDGLFRAGAFLGRTPRDAYFVRCDRSTMTQDDLDNGRVNIVVGVAPLRPAEFVTLQIGQWTANEVTEQLVPATGEPGQEISLSRHPVWIEGFVLQVEGSLGWTAWQLVVDLESTGPEDQAYVLVPGTGTVRFGDGVHGAIPSAGSPIEARYRYGSGRDGRGRSW
jgi:phage tail sheath protein FI